MLSGSWLVPRPHRSAGLRPPRWLHVVAALLVAAAFGHAVATTWNAEWPAGPDTLRDIAAAEAVRQGFGPSLKRHVPLPDPYYKRSVFWYSPLMPAVMAAGAAITNAPMHTIATRGPLLWNLVAPVAFYLLIAEIFDPLVALVSLAIFLFVEPFSSWQAATYSPTLIPSSFAQPFFYAGLLLWARYRRTRRATTAAAAGALLGCAFLAHPAPAAVLALVFAVDTLAMIAGSDTAGARVTIGCQAGFAAGLGIVTALPGAAAMIHYHGRVLEPLPFLWIDRRCQSATSATSCA